MRVALRTSLRQFNWRQGVLLVAAAAAIALVLYGNIEYHAASVDGTDLASSVASIDTTEFSPIDLTEYAARNDAARYLRKFRWIEKIDHLRPKESPPNNMPRGFYGISSEGSRVLFVQSEDGDSRVFWFANAPKVEFASELEREVRARAGDKIATGELLRRTPPSYLFFCGDLNRLDAMWSAGSSGEKALVATWWHKSMRLQGFYATHETSIGCADLASLLRDMNDAIDRMVPRGR